MIDGMRANGKTMTALLAAVAIVASGVGWWLLAGGGAPEVSAQEIVENACSQADDMVDYDLISTLTGPVNNWDLDVRFSGDDIHAIVKMKED